MPRWKVERGSRTAFPVAVDALGNFPLGPSRSPGTDRTAHRPGSRWGLRALVIGALAGAAWLLTGAAAQAADHDPTAVEATPDSSLMDTAVPGDNTEPTVAGILQAAAQPLDPDRPALRYLRQPSTLDRALTRPVATVAETIDAATRQRVTDVDPAADGVDHVGREITGTLRLIGGPVDPRLAPVTAPVIAALVPGTRGIRTVRPVTAPAPYAAGSAWAADRPEVSAAGTIAADRGATRTTDIVSRHHPAVTDWATGIRRPAARPAVAPETIRKASDDDPHVPVQVRLGGVGGVATNGSQAPADGGSAAVLPAAIAACTVAVHRMPNLADAEIRRYDAEAPTVSPD